MERYKLRLYYAAQIGDYPILGWRSGEDWPEGEDDPSEDVWFSELDAILLISDLARAGLWHKIRRCQHCSGWLLAKFSHQKFCSHSCQQNYFRSSEEYKAERRAYVKDLREKEKKRREKEKKVGYFVSPPKDSARKRPKGRRVGGKRLAS